MVRLHPSRPTAALAVALAAIASLAAVRFLSGGADGIVVYCAHDSVYSEAILNDFASRTGIAVRPVFDTEATKSLGLAEKIIREAEHPRADVFWNNEMLGTVDLAERGLLESYRGPGWERMPEAYRDDEGRWTGFAARLRVLVSTRASSDAPTGAFLDPPPEDCSLFTMAKPLYGTTLTHYVALWDCWGPDRLKSWHREIRARGLVEATGNSHVVRLVSGGTCTQGVTDTDDCFSARDEGAFVQMRPVNVANDEVLLIPNTCAIVAGSKRAGDARRLVDYLLSEECELALARSRSRQIPLGPVDTSKLPDEVRELVPLVSKAYPLKKAAATRAECLQWLKSEYQK
jgi:iron(III) transport system substrate-binding protein